MNAYSTKSGNIMYNQDGNWQENPDGTWSQAIPLPLYGLKNKCQCGKPFWREERLNKLIDGRIE